MGGKGRGVEVMREDERMRRTRGHGRIGTVADTHWRTVSGLGWASSGFNFVLRPSLPSSLFAAGNSGGLSIQVAEQLSLFRYSSPPGRSSPVTRDTLIMYDSVRRLPLLPVKYPFLVTFPEMPYLRPSTLPLVQQVSHSTGAKITVSAHAYVQSRVIYSAFTSREAAVVVPVPRRAPLVWANVENAFNCSAVALV
jgi:hypothetical protein